MLKAVVGKRWHGWTEKSDYIRIDKGFLWKPQSEKAGCAHEQQGDRDVGDPSEKRSMRIFFCGVCIRHRLFCTTILENLQ